MRKFKRGLLSIFDSIKLLSLISIIVLICVYFNYSHQDKEVWSSPAIENFGQGK
jgi:hypothetical protein